MTRDVDTGAGHVQLAEETLRQVITNLHLAEFTIRAILYEVGRSTVFITCVVRGQRGNICLRGNVEVEAVGILGDLERDKIVGLPQTFVARLCGG